MLNIFISWSGDASKAVAEKLRDWLPKVLAGHANCFVSSQDIRGGERGLDVIANELESRDFGIVVLTRENIGSPWVNFEAGALGKSLGTSRVAPVLLDVTPTDVQGPISQFQSTILADKDAMRKFVLDMAGEIDNLRLDSVTMLFDTAWAELEEVAASNAGLRSPETTRSNESMLAEILELVREQSRTSVHHIATETAAERMQRKYELLPMSTRAKARNSPDWVHRDSRGNPTISPKEALAILKILTETTEDGGEDKGEENGNA